MRYFLFTGFDYYASGGWRDFKGAYITLDDAIEVGMKSVEDWGHIIDSETLTVVAQYLNLNSEIGTFITCTHERWSELD